MPDLSNAEISVEGEYGYCLVCGESFHWEQLTNLASGSYCEADVPRLYGISKNGQRPYVYFGHDPDHQFGNDYGDRLLRINQRQQPDEAWAIVGPFTDVEREQHLATADEADMGHDTALERDTFGDAL